MTAPQEDAATVLEIFVNDVANLPAEIQHIYEELSAKDRLLSEHRSTYLTRDASLQKHIRLHGSHLENPKESVYIDQIRKNQRLVLQLQDEKLALAQKALDLIDKHSRRLDGQIANLVRDGLMPADALTPAPPPSNLPAASQHVGGRGIRQSPGLGLGRTFSERTGTPGTPRDSANKRLKLSSGLPMSTPSISSALAGRPSTPGIKTESSRAGTPSGHSGTRKTGRKKPPVKRVVDEDGDEEDDEDEEEGGEGDDKRLYCVCQQVSYGSMVGCDDKDCPYEWFHWGCVHLTEEPRGKWYCPACTERRNAAIRR
ncbi:inhibitor of growth proteins N-terminal histone-binding-domain-containing protein [Trichophaea hybrida]|nr:inhibitor of growth proteins N-terminal histone-binding-domain-containing protein [Trichophaea hybrida]